MSNIQERIEHDIRAVIGDLMVQLVVARAETAMLKEAAETTGKPPEAKVNGKRADAETRQ